MQDNSQQQRTICNNKHPQLEKRNYTIWWYSTASFTRSKKLNRFSGVLNTFPIRIVRSQQGVKSSSSLLSITTSPSREGSFTSPVLIFTATFSAGRTAPQPVAQIVGNLLRHHTVVLVRGVVHHELAHPLRARLQLARRALANKLQIGVDRLPRARRAVDHLQVRLDQRDESGEVRLRVRPTHHHSRCPPGSRGSCTRPCAPGTCSRCSGTRRNGRCWARRSW